MLAALRKVNLKESARGPISIDPNGNRTRLAYDGAGRQVSQADPLAIAATVAGRATKSDVWFCAAGTAVEGGAADVRVVLINIGSEQRVATITAVGVRVVVELGLWRRVFVKILSAKS